MDSSVNTLALEARTGNRDALTALVRALSPGVFRFAVRMTRSEEEARDVVQETFLRVMRNLDRYDPQYPFQTWIYRIARNLCIDRARHKSRWRTWFQSEPVDDVAGDPMAELPGTKDSQLDGILDRELQGSIERCLSKLSPKYREILVLFHFESLSYQEIAEILQIPIGTVMNRIFRARQQLRLELGDLLTPT